MARTRNLDPAVVLPPARSQSMEAQTFPGFPGVFVPGVPVAVSALGLSASEAARAIRELGLPLVAAEGKSDDNELSEE